MKKILTILAALTLWLSGFSQITLTHGKHALKVGDVQMMHKAEYVEPGIGGSGQVWNFSHLKLSGGDKNQMLDAANTAKHGTFPSSNVAITTGGDYHGMFKITETANDHVGYFGKDFHVIYSQPHRRMIYPFTYGNYYESTFSGYGVYENATSELAGDYSFEADGYGTLILPNNVLTNVLRVKHTLAKYEFTRCYFTETQQTRYLYYIEKNRYPVFSILETMWVSNKGDTSWIRSSAVNEAVYNVADEQLADEPRRSGERKNYVHNVYPNPFNSAFSVNFTLEEPTSVAVEFYTLEGMKLGDICSKRQLQQGFHEFEHRTPETLPSGTYFVKFIFNDDAFVFQTIKIR